MTELRSTQKAKPKPIPGLSDEGADFITCILMHMLLPLLPLLIEVWKTKGSPTEATLAISASMYSIAIGMSSRNKAIFALCVFVSILFSIVFGMLSGEVADLPFVQLSSIITMLFVFITHACERYNRHVVECVPFWDFSSAGGGN